MSNDARLRLALFAVGIGAAVLMFSQGPAQGRFIRPMLQRIPVERLLANMQAMVKEQPKDVNLRYNLARSQAMAYAQKAKAIEIWQGKEERGAWFGFTPKHVPFEVKKAATKAEAEQAMKYLNDAKATYADVIKASKGPHLGALLGHAWLVEQSGDKKQAIAEYRDTIDKAWAKEGKLRNGRLGGNYVTVEAAGYLIPLLDKDADAKEIATLKERSQHLKKLPRPVTPIAVPLRDGLTANDMIDSGASVRFDADGMNLGESWTWIRPSAAWLVYDAAGKGEIDSALQMFGNATFFMFWENGYQAMQVLDDDRDGYLAGAELNGLALWQDVNGNGISEPGEVRPLSAWGIEKLSCRHDLPASAAMAAGARQGVYFRDGSVRASYDLILQKR